MSWIAVATVGGTVAGGLISGNAAKKAQQSANATNERLADQTNAYNWNNYLAQRGISAGGNARPGEIPTSGTAVNTSLPLWFNIGGQPGEQALLNQILAASGVLPAAPAAGAPAANSDDSLMAFYASDPGFAAEYNRHMGWIAQNSPGTDRRTPLQWLKDHLQASPQTMAAYQQFASQPAAATGAQTLEVVDSLPNEYLDLQRKVSGAISDLYDGRYLDQQIAALAPILAAREAAATDINAANLAAAEGVYGAGVSAADDLLGVRRTGAQGVYDADLAAAEELFGARQTGARSIYDADLLQADTYQQSALQALNRVLAEGAAQRARQGFTGTTSGDALTRARVMADYTQQGAGVRAAAGQSLAQRLAEASIGRADTRGQSGRTLAQRLADAAAERSVNVGTAGITRAGARGQAGVGLATTRGQAREQDVLARLNLLTEDINRRLAGVNLPASLASSELAIRQAGTASRYTDLDALLSRLNQFRTSPSTPGLATPNLQPTLSNGQIVGSLVSSAGQAYGEYRQGQDLLKAIQGLGKNNLPSPDSLKGIFSNG